ncbi:helix-turn-helix domain-containing protein [Bacteroides sp. GM023]|uniref:helix-turn-helix domain-containing protein n=1 Tax=Bacteroides sp. GM023 TaxID=2723058 RepID=UPI00168B285A|nr:helix-turn-helix domain-containing protein [Bacteroides sp. GM023]MBD3591975.1 AraC family transcriptional regulator [Bacteroides sp. GM023]
MTHAYFNTLKGIILLTDNLPAVQTGHKVNDLYKFIWVQEGEITLVVDHVEKTLGKNELVTLSPLHSIEIKKMEGKYTGILFNSEFYSIYKHDEEVSCNGLLFNGTSHIVHLQLSEQTSQLLHEVTEKILDEYRLKDTLEGEMLRLLLKRFIILCTRLAREQVAVPSEKMGCFDIIRQYSILVDNHFKEKKQVSDYAEMLHRSPKTLSNIFASYQLPSPIKIIHERIISEAKRLLLNSPASVKEIATFLGFEHVCTFSRFFKHITGENISDYRKKYGK